jgi:molybdopterin-guanine dinucleotide biosynthesis protein A
VPIPGLLLTGGASSRMGTAKATLLRDGATLAARSARLLQRVCDPVVEIGPGYTELRRVTEEPAGDGPLAALVAGARALPGSGPVLLLACDLPFVTEALLRRLATGPGADTVVPVDRDGIVQPVCARYSEAALERARVLVDAGERSLRPLLTGPGVTRLEDVDELELIDVDTPADAREWGIRLPDSLEP